VRGFWRGDSGLVGDLAGSLLGSPVQFNHSDRGATSSINFLAAHDGFTLMDTVSFNERHNDANGEGGADGHDHNISDNMGAEGATEDAAIVAARARRRRNLIATLLLSQGVPMILAGDEIGNTQSGNNNVYCQDNETAWIDWGSRDDGFSEFVSRMIAFRREHPVLSQDTFLLGDRTDEDRVEIAWYQPDGREMDEELWGQSELRVLGLFVDHSAKAAFVENENIGALFVVINAGGDLTFTLPECNGVASWVRVVDTSRDDAFDGDSSSQVGAVDIAAASVSVFAPAQS